MVVPLVRAGGEPSRVEDVELRLGAEEGGVGDPGALEVRLGLGGDVARVARVRRAGQRVEHRERQVQRLVLAERVEHGRRRVRQQQHVGLVDGLEPADGRAVEHPPLGEDVRVEGRHRDGEVLDGTRQVAEPDVNELHLLLSDEREDFFGRTEHQPSLYRARIRSFIEIFRRGRASDGSRPQFPAQYPRRFTGVTRRLPHPADPPREQPRRASGYRRFCVPRTPASANPDRDGSSPIARCRCG